MGVSAVLPYSVEVIPTGSLRVDIALGCGGLPRGHMIEVYGPENAGKTSLALNLSGAIQEQGHTCVYIDMDRTLDRRHARLCQINPSLLVSQPPGPQQLLDTVTALLRTGSVDLIVIDSITPLLPAIEGEIQPACDLDAAATLLPEVIRQLNAALRFSRTALVVIHQTATRATPVYHQRSSRYSARSLYKHALLHLGVGVLEKDTAHPHFARLTVGKSKFSPSSHIIDLDIMYNDISKKTGEILDLGIELSIIREQGAALYFSGIDLGAGREAAIDFLRSRSQTCQDITQAIRQAVLPPAIMPVAH